MVGWLKFVKTFFDDDHFEESCQHKKKIVHYNVLPFDFVPMLPQKFSLPKAHKQAFAIC